MLRSFLPIASCITALLGTGLAAAATVQVRSAAAALGAAAPPSLELAVVLALAAAGASVLAALAAGLQLRRAPAAHAAVPGTAVAPDEAPPAADEADAASATTLAQVVSATTAVDATAGFPALLASVDGDRALYASIAADARESVAEESAALKAALHADDLPEAVLHANGLKTLAALLGDEMLRELARAVMKAAEAGALGEAVHAYLPLHAVVKDVLAALEHAAGSAPASSPTPERPAVSDDRALASVDAGDQPQPVEEPQLGQL